MFIQSFANYIKNEYENILFIALSEETRTIHLISIFFEDKDHEEFLNELRNNPYTEDITVEYFSEIIKGEQILKFKDEWVKIDDDIEEEEEEDSGEFSKKKTMEINFDDEDVEDIKF